MDMFSDLRQFAEAKAWAEEWDRIKASEQVSGQPASNSSSQAGAASHSLVQRQAEWNEEMKDFQAAAEMYLQACQYSQPAHSKPVHSCHKTKYINAQHACHGA